MTLFDFTNTPKADHRPLADRMRPRNLDEFFGQEHLIAKGRLLRRAIEADRLTSSIFYGPPGSGKTTLASVIAGITKADFVRMNAVTSGVQDLREMLKKAKERRSMCGKSTYLLLDECHRWNKAQSDSILPAIEEGLIYFIGSTTENPMIAMTPAIVSRCRIFAFHPLGNADVEKALTTALNDMQRGVGALHVTLDTEALHHIVNIANGDCRMALNALELAVLSTPTTKDGIHITLEIAEESIQKPVIQCDESLFYDMLSAFCKSMRGSDSDAALLWFSRLLYAGADPRLLARRIIAHASEDVGIANPQAMVQAVSAAQALELIGMPEARIPLAQAIIMVCESPKSNSVITAIEGALSDAKGGMLGAVPSYLHDTSYQGHQRLQNNETYLYPHNYEGHWVQQNYMPSGFENKVYYTPGKLGYEKDLVKKKDKER